MGKASRKKKETRDLGLLDAIAQPNVGQPGWLRAIGEAASRHMASHWRPGASDPRRVMSGVFAAADRIVDLIQQNLALLRSGKRTALRIACERGCNHCCYAEVTAAAPEILAIAAHVRE